MDDLEIVYALRRRIIRLENKLKKLTFENTQNNCDINKQTVARINKIEARLIKVKGIHNDSIHLIYSNISKRPQIDPLINSIQMKINEIHIGDNLTKIKMTPIWFKLDEKKNSLKNIIYPTDGTDRNLIITIARYRTIVNQSKDFCQEPLNINQNSIETILIGLENFVHQYEGELCFINKNISYSNGIENAVCGIFNLGNIHLLTENFIPTAKFSIKFNLNYDRDLTQTNLTMKNFILKFIKEIAQLLMCKNNFIRIFSIEKLDQKSGMIKIHFGLTTPEKNQTISLAKHFQNFLRRSDFRDKDILRFIQSDSYQYELIPSLSYLQISPNDFYPQQNYDYTLIDRSTKEQCGNYPYYLPIGWFRHALNLSNKYSHDDIWFGHQNIDGEWPIAFHGTRSQANTDDNNTEQRRKTDVGSSFYVATHCNDGADAYTTPFTISNGDHHETFRMVFQCRVRPDSFTIHTGIMEQGEVWQIRDPQAIRPYGLLLKNETIKS